MKIYAFVSNKGGVTKTTSTISLSTALARAGRRVLMVDMDGQASLSEYFFELAIIMGINPSMSEMLLDRTKSVFVQPIPLNEHLYILPANPRLADAELIIAGYTNPQGLLKLRLRAYQDKFDVCLIDTPPATGLLTRNALGAADYAIIPIATEKLAYRTLPQTLAQIDAMVEQEANTGLELWRIIPTLHDAREIEDRGVLQDLKDNYGDYLYNGVIPRRTNYKKAVSARADIIDIDPELGKIWDQLAQDLYSETILNKIGA